MRNFILVHQVITGFYKMLQSFNGRIPYVCFVITITKVHLYFQNPLSFYSISKESYIDTIPLTLKKSLGFILIMKKVKDINIILYHLLLLQRCKVSLGALFLSFLLNVLCFNHKMFLFQCKRRMLLCVAMSKIMEGVP